MLSRIPANASSDWQVGGGQGKNTTQKGKMDKGDDESGE